MISAARKLAVSLLSLAVLGTLLGAGALNLQAAAAQELQVTPPVNAKTDNDSVNVVIDWTPEEIEPGQSVEFSLGFQNPTSGESLAHVNYDVEFMDEAGSVVESVEDVHSHDGSEVHSIIFDSTGNLKMVVTVIGTGLTPPYDTTRSGTTELAIMVVPEFPVAPTILAAATGLIIAFRKLKILK
ncbi:MAG: hypothetical protein ACREBU_11805 [Nitrososphaera sp.]